MNPPVAEAAAAGLGAPKAGGGCPKVELDESADPALPNWKTPDEFPALFVG